MAAAISEILLKNSRSGGILFVNRRGIVAAKFSTDSCKLKEDETLSKNPLFNPKLGAMKRGTGGRSSFNGIVATVFGATGFVGKYVCNRLGKIGTQLIIPYRGDHYPLMPLKLVGDLGQVLFFHYNLRDEESITKAMKHSNVVVNLIGRDWETKNYKYDDVHVTGARTIARLAKEAGVKRLIHFSALNSSPNPKGMILPDGSEFLKSKHFGESAVMEEFPTATIFRPSDIYGAEDRFLRYYAHAWRRQFNVLPLWEKGMKTEKQPVYVGDVAQAVVNALRDPETQGKRYDLYGPDRWTLHDLVQWMLNSMRRTKAEGYKITDLKWSIPFRFRVTATETICPSWPVAFLGWDKMERDHMSDIVNRSHGKLEDLGVTPTQLADRLEFELQPHRNNLDYDADVGEFPTPEPPTPIKSVYYQ